jgi:isopentenyl diphosphate isomerase/L-lactate dehydrogenase-like FMN-dependent dehydrogenase
LNLLRRELEVSMALTGCTDIRQVDAAILWRHGMKAAAPP